MKRIPLDIEFLLESITGHPLNEDPNSLKLSSAQIEILNQQGVDAHLGKVYFDSNDAISFIIDVRSKITLYNVPEFEVPPMTHPDLGNQIMIHGAHPNDFIKFKPSRYAGLGIKPSEASFERDSPGPTMGSIAIIQATTPSQLTHCLRNIRSNMPLDGDIPKSRKDFIQGRIWMNHDMMSFWSKKEHVIKHFDLVNEFLVGIKKKKEEVAYEFIDSNHFYTFDELSGKTVLTRSKEEILDLMRQQHLNPNAKKKLAAMQNTLSQKKNSGFDFQAQKDAAMPALQEIVKQINNSK